MCSPSWAIKCAGHLAWHPGLTSCSLHHLRPFPPPRGPTNLACPPSAAGQAGAAQLAAAEQRLPLALPLPLLPDQYGDRGGRDQEPEQLAAAEPAVERIGVPRWARPGWALLPTLVSPAWQCFPRNNFVGCLSSPELAMVAVWRIVTDSFCFTSSQEIEQAQQAQQQLLTQLPLELETASPPPSSLITLSTLHSFYNGGRRPPQAPRVRRRSESEGVRVGSCSAVHSSLAAWVLGVAALATHVTAALMQAAGRRRWRRRGGFRRGGCRGSLTAAGRVTACWRCAPTR